jgi:6-phosphogluconolactonase
MNNTIKIFPNIEELNDFAAEKFVGIAHDAIEQRGRFTVALAGGSTPKALYRLLASEKFKDKIDWNKGYYFLGDERHVLPDAAESNYRMARETLFEPVGINEQNIFWWNTRLQPELCTECYRRALRWQFRLREDSFPRFDLILLGMGADGHTASLFPNTEALRETDEIAVPNYVEQLQTTRLTFTFPTINNAQNVIFLVAGEEKAETLKQVLEGEFQPDKLPSQNVKPHNGDLYWLLDEKAASLLKHK